MTPIWVTVLSVVLGSSIFGVIGQQLGKRQEEKRLSQSAALERDLRTSELFVQLIGLANARGDPIMVEAIATRIGTMNSLEADLDRAAGGDVAAQERIKYLGHAAIRTAPVGRAAQRAAAGLIVSLARQHTLLRSAAIEGLTDLKPLLPDGTPVDEWITELRALPTTPD